MIPLKYSLILLILVLVTAVTTAFAIPESHPFLMTFIAPVFFVLWWSVTNDLSKNSAKQNNQSVLTEWYFILLLAVMTVLLGLGVQMNLLPLFFHQLAAWPLLIMASLTIRKNF